MMSEEIFRSLNWRSISDATCRECTGRDCLVSRNRTRVDARSCPSLLNPGKLASNKDCLVCGQCVKSCQPDNMRLLLRRPFSFSDVREALAS
jgi:polyferredoxin